MDNYKGIYFGVNAEAKSFEGGAHFSYKELYSVLSAIYETLPSERQGIENEFSEECTKIGNNNSKNPIIQSLTEKIKGITKVKLDEMNQDLILTLKNTNFIKPMPQNPCLTEETNNNDHQEEKSKNEKNSQPLFKKEVNKNYNTRNINIIGDLLRVGHNTKNTLNYESRNKSLNTNHNKTDSSNLNTNNKTATSNACKRKIRFIPSITCLKKEGKNFSFKNLNYSSSQTKHKPNYISHIKTPSTANYTNKSFNKSKKQSISNFINDYCTKQVNFRKAKNPFSKSNTKLQINSLNHNNNIIIKPKINISFINNITTTEPNENHSKSRNMNYVNYSSTLAKLNKTFNFGSLGEVNKYNHKKSFSKNGLNNLNYVTTNKTFCKTKKEVTKSSPYHRKKTELNKSKKQLIKMNFDFANLFIKKDKTKQHNHYNGPSYNMSVKNK